MNILFLHPNFPGQFKNNAKYFAERGCDVRFICQTHYNRKLPKITRYCIKGELGDEELKKTKGSSLERAQKMAKQYERALWMLAKDWTPDVVISHSGWGCGTFVKRVWPGCKHIAYVEWWFNPESDLFDYDENNQELQINKSTISKQYMRNSVQALELVTADCAVSPTVWQKKQLPKSLQANCKVIHDGVDIKKFKPRSHECRVRKITYGTRGMEPMRAFPQFIRSLPEALAELDDFTVEIAGEDEVNYGGRLNEYKSWKKWAINFLEEHNISSRVRWVGRLCEKDYIKWLQETSCHVYLTHPYVASWSLLEAIFSGCQLVISDVKTTKEFYIEESMEFVDHREIGSIIEGIIKTCRKPKRAIDTKELRLPKKFKDLTLDSACEQWALVAGLDLATVD